MGVYCIQLILCWKKIPLGASISQGLFVNYEQGRYRGQDRAGEEDGLAIPVNALTLEVWAMW